VRYDPRLRPVFDANDPVELEDAGDLAIGWPAYPWDQEEPVAAIVNYPYDYDNVGARSNYTICSLGFPVYDSIQNAAKVSSIDIIEYIIKHQPCTTSDIGRAFYVKPDYILRRISRLNIVMQNEGFHVVSVPVGLTTSARLYSIEKL
jgi:hypothetical protein